MGVHSPTIMGEIAKREREVSEVSDHLLYSRPGSVLSRTARLRELAMDCAALSQPRSGGSEAHLRKHIQSVVMGPN
jgi:hypothetical protein